MWFSLETFDVGRQNNSLRGICQPSALYLTKIAENLLNYWSCPTSADEIWNMHLCRCLNGLFCLGFVGLFCFVRICRTDTSDSFLYGRKMGFWWQWIHTGSDSALKSRGWSLLPAPTKDPTPDNPGERICIHCIWFRCFSLQITSSSAYVLQKRLQCLEHIETMYRKGKYNVQRRKDNALE